MINVKDNNSTKTGIIKLSDVCNDNRKNSIRDARTSQPGEIVFNIMRYRSSETAQTLGYFQSSVSYIKLPIMFKKITSNRKKKK